MQGRVHYWFQAGCWGSSLCRSDMVRMGGNVPYGWCWGHSVGRFGEWLPRPVEDVFLWDREDLARCVRDHYGRGVGHVGDARHCGSVSFFAFQPLLGLPLFPMCCSECSFGWCHRGGFWV